MVEKKQSLGFTLFVDEDLNDLFSCFALLFDQLVRQAVAEGGVDEIKELLLTFDSFVDKIKDPVHELGWCKDIDCTWEKDEKNKQEKKDEDL
jgi:hypothetical protein